MADESIFSVVSALDDLMQMVNRTFHSTSDKYLSGLDITLPQFMVMRSVFLKDCPKMTDLAREFSVTMGNMTAMIDRLIKQKLVVRKDDPEDRRIVRVCLTVKAKGIIKKAIDRKKRNLELILGKMSCKDRGELAEMIKKVAQAMNLVKGELVS